MGQVIDILEFACGDIGLSDPETKKTIHKAIQRAWYKIIRRHAWQFCRRTFSIAATTADTAGMLLPGDMVNILGPIQDTSDVMYMETAPNILPQGDGNYWYYLDNVAVNPLLEQRTTLSINEGATTFTLAGWDASYIGEYIKFGSEPGIYLLSGTKTISQAYWGPKISGGTVIVRPNTTRRLSFIDGDGDRVAVTATAHYWAFPAPLYHEWQTFPDHLTEPLKWATVAEVKGYTIDKKRGLAMRDYGPEFDRELFLAIASDPAPPIVEIRRDNRGLRRTLGRRG